MKAESEQSSSSSRKRRLATPLFALPEPRTYQPKEWSPLTLATLKAMKERAEKRGRKRMSMAVSVRHFDNADANYDWLLPGWVAEERYVPTGRRGLGRLYKYYYDPTGQMYYSKREVLFAWTKMNVIYLDA